jgi:hypothetical protein
MTNEKDSDASKPTAKRISVLTPWKHATKDERDEGYFLLGGLVFLVFAGIRGGIEQLDEYLTSRAWGVDYQGDYTEAFFLGLLGLFCILAAGLANHGRRLRQIKAALGLDEAHKNPLLAPKGATPVSRGRQHPTDATTLSGPTGSRGGDV